MRSGTIAMLILAALGPVGPEKPVAAQPPDILPKPVDFVVEDFADVSDCRTLERRGPALLSLTNEGQQGQSWAVWKWQRQPLQDKHRSLYEGQPYLADLWPPFYPLPGQPQQVHLQVQGDGQGVRLRAALLDAQEEVFYFDLGTVDFQDWRELSVSLDNAWKSGEGHVNGKLDFPLRFDALIAEVPDGVEQFEVGLADLTVTTGVEEDERLALGVWTSDGRTVHQETAEPFKFRLRVANLFDKQRSADVSWTVQREGQEVARAEQTVRLDASESHEIEWPFEAEKAGLYTLHAQARSEKVHREQALRVRVGPPQPDPQATIDADVGEHGELIEVRVNGQVMLRNFEFALLGPQYQVLGRNGVEHFQPVHITEEGGARVFEDTFGDEKFQVRSRVAVRVTPDQISLDYAFTSEASLTLWQLSIGGWMPCRETDESFFFVGSERREFPGGIPSWPLFLQYRKEGEIGWFRETGEGLRCRPRWPRQPYIFLEDYRWRYNYGNVLRFVPVLYGELKPGQTVRFGLELEPIREWLVESVTRDQAPPPAKDPAAWQTSTPAPPPFENDRRLQRTISLAEQGTPLPQVLEKLSAALNTPLRAAGAVRGETVSLTLPEQPAPALLKRLADAVHGVWRAEGPRYVLGERPDPDRQRGDQLLASGRYEEALEAYEKALARGANEAEAYQGKGKCYWYLHDYQNAIHHYEEVLLRDPDDPEAYIGLGGSYRALGEHEKAIGYFQELLKRAPDSVWGRVELGLVQGALNETEAAVQTFQEAARTAPGMWQPRYYLAEAYFQTGDFEKCQQTLREALKLPLDGPARNQLQELLTRAEAMTDH